MSTDRAAWRCSESLYGEHGPADRDGRCRWCRKKYCAKQERPRSFDLGTPTVSALEGAYAYAYDPGWGGREHGDEVAWR